MNHTPDPTDGAVLDHDASTGPATVVDLTAGPALITPVHVDGDARYAVTVPDTPLTEDDLHGLTVALQVASSGPAVLVDVEEYAATDD